MAVYSIYDDKTEEYETQGGLIKTEQLDGDFESVIPLGIDFHPKTGGATLEDGTRVKKHGGYQGLPVDMSGLPKRVRWGGSKRQLNDFLKAGRFLLNEKVRDVIEALEPGVHQYQPVELIWTKDDSHVGDYFWFNVCNRLDGMDRDHTTHDFNEKIGKWWHVNGREYVVSRSQVGDHHIWIDPRTQFGTIWCSEAFKQATAAAGVTGIGFGEHRAV